MSGVPGQGSTYDAEKADRILMFMHEGVTLTRACAFVKVARSTFLSWREANHDELLVRYARAREALHDRWADDIVDVADDRAPDSVAAHNSQRLSVEARKWLLSKLRPEQYGDSSKQTIDLSVKGEDPATVLAARRKARVGNDV